MGLDDDPLKKKYGGSFTDIIDNQMTLENEERMVKAFKVMACICATEKVKK